MPDGSEPASFYRACPSDTQKELLFPTATGALKRAEQIIGRKVLAGEFLQAITLSRK